MEIIEENRPTLDAATAYANALPKGVKNSAELEGFSGLQFQSYRRFGKNLYGLTVYDITYTLLYRYGGSYKGKGCYLDSITILPHELEIAWGYKVSLAVKGLAPTNVGTHEAPVASLLMELDFRIATVVRTAEFRANYEFRGDSREVRSFPAGN